MAVESVASRIETASASIDGVAAILQGIVSEGEDIKTSRVTYSCADLLARISNDLDEIAIAVSKEA